MVRPTVSLPPPSSEQLTRVEEDALTTTEEESGGYYSYYSSTLTLSKVGGGTADGVVEASYEPVAKNVETEQERGGRES
ncbi:hypothetical protein DPEC_G00114730 [Dallia pectoralis]|uniref:Uncharacterized protein n=1 Tax=Dallia pectoralis TaxID=75939 RepID=A0ACC2GUD0_DALPE|nr:hypothetical protein DPEC_G00114730 [Dallia pectoralis]